MCSMLWERQLRRYGANWAVASTVRYQILLSNKPLRCRSEALKAHSLGRRGLLREGFHRLPFLRRAVELDPNFAMAYARLGFLWELGEPNLAAENTRKAYELRERVSELEYFYIESHYYHTTGELEKARQVYELWAQKRSARLGTGSRRDCYLRNVGAR